MMHSPRDARIATRPAVTCYDQGLGAVAKQVCVWLGAALSPHGVEVLAQRHAGAASASDVYCARRCCVVARESVVKSCDCWVHGIASSHTDMGLHITLLMLAATLLAAVLRSQAQMQATPSSSAKEQVAAACANGSWLRMPRRW